MLDWKFEADHGGLMAKKSETGTEADAAKELESARERFGEVVDSKIRGIKGGAGKATERVKKQAEKVTASAKEKAGAVTASAKEKAEAVTASAKETLEGARESAREGYDKVTKDLEHLGKDVNEYVRQNPGKAIAMAAGAGFVLGLLLRGRRD